ncbi:MAG: FtsW/RodA/SpoVE family cell cycle protein [Phycisphaerae bacterium]|nr:FtsW/RodA/SpoVE family cell cycle protein [Phycisphaerae bacterium]
MFGEGATLAHPAWLTALASLGLSLLGLHCIGVATAPPPAAPGGEAFEAPAGFFSGWGGRQTLYLLIGLVAALFVCVPRPRVLRLFSWPAMLGVLALLVFLLVPWVPDSIVTPRNGTRGWISLGVFDLQPSELAKIAFVLVTADYLRHRRTHRTLLGLIPPGVLAFVPIVLITLQPDFGTALLFIPALFAMLLAAGARLKHLGAVVVIAALAAPAAYPLLLPHQKQRIVGLIEQVRGDRQSAHGVNYQSFTAMTLAGAGRASGLDESRARTLVRFNRLPERHNDMITSIVMARFGLLGGLGLIVLYLTWMLGGLLAAALCRDPFGRLVIVGLSAFVGAQAVVNLGMNVGVLPIIGVPLPYVSYGGSSLISMWVATGLVTSIAMRRPSRGARDTFEFADE